MSLGPAELARGRHRLYALLGQLLVEGPRPEVLRLARAVPALAAVLPAPDADTGTLDELAADHYTLLTEVPPVASAILGDDGLIGGPEADAVRAAYQAGGFHPGRTDVAIDHVGLQLAYLAHLCAAEASALEDDAGAALQPLQQLQRGFLDEHLLRWLPAWVVATAGAGGPAWRTVAELALELVASHRSALPGPSQPPALPGHALDLEDPEVDLRRIATTIARPARSGWLLSKTALARAAAAAGVATGPGDRARALSGALEGAASLGQLQPLLTALLAELGAFEEALAHTEEALALPTGAWRAQLDQTRALLTTVRHAVIQEE